MLRLSLRTVFLLSLLSAPAELTAQETTPLRVLIECQDTHCDLDYLQKDLPFVDHVRNRQDADVHITVTTQPTGSGGTAYTLRFLRSGEPPVALSARAALHASADDTRRLLAQRLKIGLLRFVTDPAVLDAITVGFEAADAAGDHAGGDRWNGWIFDLGAGGSLSGEQNSTFRSANGYLATKRTSERWKTIAGISGENSLNRFTVGDDTIHDASISVRTGFSIARALSPHLSAGVRGSAERNDYLNQDIAARLSPAIEYSVLPYDEAEHRQATLLYRVGPEHFAYQETTIFGKDRETILSQSLTGALLLKEPWGFVYTSLTGSHHLPATERYRIDLFTEINVNLARGLAVSLTGEYRTIRDQIYLSAGGLDRDEALLRSQQNATSYQYGLNLGIRYSFGSIYSGTVNPRMGGIF